MRVELSGEKFTFPQRCACCGGGADSSYQAAASKTRGQRKVTTVTRGWEFPYCSACLHHVGTWNSAGGAFFAVLVVTAIVGWLTMSATVFVLGLVAAVWARVALRRRAERERSAHCVSARPAVEFLGWHGSLKSFAIESREYAAEFMRMNQSKLVNLSSEARSLLLSPLGAPPQVSSPVRVPAPPRTSERTAASLISPVAPSLPTAGDDDITAMVAELESLKGPASRRTALSRSLARLRTEQARQRLLLEASRIEVEAVLDKVDSLKTKSAKRRNLEAAIEQLRNDPVPDELQAQQIRWLTAALRELDVGP